MRYAERRMRRHHIPRLPDQPLPDSLKCTRKAAILAAFYLVVFRLLAACRLFCPFSSGPKSSDGCRCETKERNVIDCVDSSIVLRSRPHEPALGVICVFALVARTMTNLMC